MSYIDDQIQKLKSEGIYKIQICGDMGGKTNYINITPQAFHAIYKMLKNMEDGLPLLKVKIEVRGGCAYTTERPYGVAVDIIDHDDREE